MQLFVSAFKDDKIRVLALVFLLLMIGWSGYFSFIPVFVYDRFGFGATQVGLFITDLAVGFAIGTGILVNLVSKYFSLKKAVAVNSLITGVLVLMTALNHVELYAWVLPVLTGMSMALAYALTISLFSAQVVPERQGWIMGISSSVLAFAFATTSFALGFTAIAGAEVPLLIAGACLLLSGVAMALVKRMKE